LRKYDGFEKLDKKRVMTIIAAESGLSL
jgi:hypothetical protein